MKSLDHSRQSVGDRLPPVQVESNRGILERELEMAIDNMLKRYTDERDNKLQLIDNLTAAADEGGRDLYETELQTIGEAQARIRSINTHIDTLSQDLELADTTRDRIRSLDPSVIARDFSYRSAGEFVWDMLHQHENPDAQLRINRFQKRAAEHMGFDKANTVAVAGGYNGLVVAPVLGPVLDPLPAGRPLFSSLNPRQLTTLSFVRPRIVDPNMATGVGIVALEKSEMPSKAWDIVGETITTRRIGGYINVSGVLEEMIAGSLDMVVTHMNRRIEVMTEAAVVTEFGTTTISVPLVAGATAAQITTAIGLASTAVIRATGSMPTNIAMGPTAWGRLVGTSDTTGRPFMPAIGPVNAPNTSTYDSYMGSIGGLNVVVTPAITTPDMYVYNSFGLEVYERKMPLMQSLEPSLYGRQVAVSSYLGFYKPITTEATTVPVAPAVRGSIAKITWAP